MLWAYIIHMLSHFYPHPQNAWLNNVKSPSNTIPNTFIFLQRCFEVHIPSLYSFESNWSIFARSWWLQDSANLRGGAPSHVMFVDVHYISSHFTTHLTTVVSCYLMTVIPTVILVINQLRKLDVGAPAYLKKKIYIYTHKQIEINYMYVNPWTWTQKCRHFTLHHVNRT